MAYNDYPTADELKRLTEINDPYELTRYIESIWWMPDWGFDLNGNSLELHTGGWSGNEEVIEELQKTSFYKYIKKHKRGGHYYFKLPKPPKQ